MKTMPRYLVAKYVADPKRTEPVNIGVVVWANGHTAMRFLGSDESVALVNDVKDYNRRLEHWGNVLSKDSIETGNRGDIAKKSPDFIDAFSDTRKGNYILADGGEILDKVIARNVKDAAEYLYEELVARKGTHAPTPRD